jgi:hypothetical protein
MSITPRTAEEPLGSSAGFDPYFKWLGIPPHEQPPTHYRLLAIPLFTADPNVIENAADQRMAHLRTVQTGQSAALSQSLLDQIAQARACLLDRVQKGAYDAQLRASFRPPSVPPPLRAAVVSPGSIPVASFAPRSPNRSRTRKSPAVELIKIALGGIAGLVLGYLALCWINPGYDFLRLLAAAPTTAGQPAQSPPPRADESTGVAPAATPPASAESGDNNRAPPQDVTPPAVVVAAPPVDKRAALQANRDAAVSRGDLVAALQAAGEIAALSGSSPLEEQLALLATWKTDPLAARREVADHLAKLLEQAVAEGQLEISARHVDRLLALARLLDDQALERRATLIALKRPAER